MKCTHCGYDEVPEGAQVCPRCRRELPQEGPPGAQITVDQRVGSVTGEGRVTAVDIARVEGPLTIVERPLSPEEAREQARAREIERLRQGVQALERTLQAQLEASSAPAAGNPYKGLRKYGLSDEKRFTGRARAQRELYRLVRQDRLTVLHSESGAGKTSLLQAGILPLVLRAGDLAVCVRARDLNPALAVKSALVRGLDDAPGLKEEPLDSFLHRVCAILGPGRTLYVFLDQFEEFFTKRGEEERSAFVRELAMCCDDTGPGVHWVISLRTEFFGRLSSFRDGIELHYEDYYLDLLTHAEARQAVAEPAAQVGVRFDEGLIDDLLDELAPAERVRPPQVQLVCSALYDELAADQTLITRAMVEEQHGAGAILADHLERVLRRLEHRLRPAAHRLLEELIDEDQQRVWMTRDDLVKNLSAQRVPADAVDTILKVLQDAYLVDTVETGEYGQEVAYELVHDYLAQQIPRDESHRAFKSARRLFEDKLRAFKQYEEKHQVLLTATELAIVKPYEEDLCQSAEARSLMDRSKRAARRRQNLDLFGGLTLILLVVGAVVALSLMLGAFQARNTAATREAEAATRAVRADRAADAAATREAGAILAADVAGTREAEAILAADAADAREAVANAAIRQAFEDTGIVPVGRSPHDLAFDGRYLWVANYDDETVQAVDPESGIIRATFPVFGSPAALTFDGERMWVATDSGDIHEIDPTHGVTDTIFFYIGPVDDMVYADGRLWVSSGSGYDYTADPFCEALGSQVQPVDLTERTAEDPIIVGCYQTDLAAYGDRVWVNAWGNVFELQPGMEAVSWGSAYYDFYTIGGEVEFDGQQIWAIANSELGGANQDRLAHDLVFDPVRAWMWAVDADQSLVWAIDTRTGRRSASTVRVGTSPSALAVAGESLWVANEGDGTVQRVDLSPGVLFDPIRAGNGAGGLAFDGELVWVANRGDDTVQAIDGATGKTRHTVAVGDEPLALAWNGASLWVVNRGDGTLQEIDPGAGAVLRTIPVGGDPFLLAADGRRIWVAHNDPAGTLLAVDVESGAVVHELELSTIYDLAFDGDLLWVAVDHETKAEGVLIAVNPSDGQVVESRSGQGYQIEKLVYDGNSLWFASNARSLEIYSSYDGALVQVDDWGEFAATVPFGSVQAVALAGNQLWVVDNEYLRAVDLETHHAGKSLWLGYAPRDVVFDGERLWFTYGEQSVAYLYIFSED